MRAGIYTRISDDGEGLGLGVGRQEDDGRALCQRQGWTVVRIYRDNDRSAFSGKPRPEYLRMLDDVKNGELDVIVCWHPDRLHRSPLELEHFIELLEITGVSVATCTAGDRDFATADGRFLARLEGTIARRESEHKSERIRRKHKELVEGGVSVGGSRRPFGYEWVMGSGGKRVGLEVVPAEATLVREAARRVLSGESLYSIVKDWTSRGLVGVTGAPWSTKTLRQILVAGRIAGWRDYRGEPTTRSDQWTPLVDESTWRSVRAILTDPARRHTRVPRRYLLGQGLLRCGECGGLLVATPWIARGQLTPRYGCRLEKGGCGRVSILAEPVEAIVSEAVIEALGNPAFLARLRGADEGAAVTRLEATIAEMEASLEMLAQDFYVLKVITRPEFMAVRDRLVPRIDAARAELAAITRRKPSAVLEGLDDLRDRWEGLGLDRRRALIQLAVESVTIASAEGRGGTFDPSRVQPPVWRA
jgi:DNA invertase Pin-like site-specific DNA recombinase